MLRTALFLLTAVGLTAQSHPQWWTWASPEATALVGVRWDTLRDTKTGKAIDAELFGPLGFTLPDLACIKQSRQFLLSSPPFLAIAFGQCKSATLASQAPARGLHRILFKGVEVWMAKDGLSIARLTDQVVLLASLQTLEATIEQSQSDEGRQYSPLLARAAALSQQNLWIVSSNAKDALAGRFAALEDAANYPDDHLEPLPVSAAKPVPAPVPVPASVVAVNGVATPTPEPSPPVLPKADLPPVRRVIRIVGLDEGPREIELPSSGK